MPLKDIMRRDFNQHIQIAVAGCAGFTLPAQAQRRAGIHAGRNLNFDFTGNPGAAFPPAIRTGGLDYRALAAAAPAGLGQLKKPVRDYCAALTFTLRTGNLPRPSFFPASPTTKADFI